MEKKSVRRDLLIVAFASLVLCYFFINMSFRGGGDDVKFVTIAEGHSLFSWISMRFTTWSARIASEAFIYIFAKLPIICWKLTTAAFCVILSIFFYKYALLFKLNPHPMLAVFCSFAPFLMNLGAFVEGVLWVTGAMNYLWITTFGFVGMYYVTKSVLHGKESLKLYERIITPLLLLLCVSSSEQLGAVIIVLLALLNIWQFSKKNVSLYNILLFIGCIALYVTVVFLSPGVALRKADDIARYIPDFESVGLLSRLQYSIRWILDAIVNHFGLLLNLVWLMELILLLNKKAKRSFDWILITVVFFAQIITLFKDKFPALFDFSAQWGLKDFSSFGYFTIAMWAIILLCTAIAVFTCFEDRIKGCCSCLLVLAAYASTAIMVFSATMYESGCRVMYHSSLIIVILLLLFLSEINAVSKTQSNLIYPKGAAIAAYLGCGIYQYLTLAQALSEGFRIHFPW